ncbi:transposase family protein [Nocardia sp. NPDC047038]|uniref:transposase family protein n=1 Tax=Nocardia sp. NPDC047038 TaxID=3154338 RepID=UPI0033D37257
MSVTYVAVLPIAESTVEFVVGLLTAERRRRGTRWRKLGCLDQAVLALRWFVDGTRVAQLACDNGIGKTTAYDYLHEVIDMLAAQALDLHNALLAAKTAGYEHLGVDGTLIYTDRLREPGPALGKNGKPVDLWWSGKHHHHGGNIQVVTAPDGWPLWTSHVLPGRTHDVTALRTHPEMLPSLKTSSSENPPLLGDLGYEGEAGTITVATKKPTDGELTNRQRTANKAHNSKRAVGERGNSLLKTTFKALRRISLCPYRIGSIVAAALVLLHVDHGRTT